MSGPVMTEEQLANLSDEELMNMAIPPAMEAPAAKEEESHAQEEETNGAADAGQNAGDSGDIPDSNDDQNDTAGTADDSQSGNDTSGDESLSQDDDKFAEALGSKKDVADPSKDKGDKAPDEKPGAKTEDGQKPEDLKSGDPDYKGFYEKIMTPFKANGKEIKLQSPEEAITLMQMGANYTKKLQALQPNLKLLKMLENNELLDPGKLSFLIDVSKKDPAAIQKLIRESGIDPMDIDTTQEPTYQAKDYQVSDAEMTFTTTLEEVASDPVGKEMIIHINKNWDGPSKEALWADPQILRVMTEQKHNGIYDQIASEVERRQVLGQFRGVPFLQAYYHVGQEMQGQGRLVPKTQATATPPASQVIETRPAKKPAPSNTDKARAASPTKTAPPKAAPSDFNPLALSDEDFEKTQGLANRL